MFSDISFAYPYVLYLLLLLPLLAVWYWKRHKKSTPDFTYSNLRFFSNVKPTLRESLKHLPAVLRILALGLLIVALARPQSFSTGENVNTEGIDISMVLDISGSMLAEDFEPNRLEAAKNVMNEFIEGRTSDKIGLVVFAREAFTQCPLTIDYSVLRNLLRKIESGMIEDGTAIGNAIANGVNRLKESDAESKVMILATDGVNNAGEVDPRTAAEIARKFDIRIYTIGIGSKGKAPYPFKTPFGTRYQNVPVEIDEELLTEIANETGGNYYRATDNKKLNDIYTEIDKLEKTEVEVTSYKRANEKFYGWLGLGLLLVVMEVSLTRTYLKNLP